MKAEPHRVAQALDDRPTEAVGVAALGFKVQPAALRVFSCIVIVRAIRGAAKLRPARPFTFSKSSEEAMRRPKIFKDFCTKPAVLVLCARRAAKGLRVLGRQLTLSRES